MAVAGVEVLRRWTSLIKPTTKNFESSTCLPSSFCSLLLAGTGGVVAGAPEAAPCAEARGDALGAGVGGLLLGKEP